MSANLLVGRHQSFLLQNTNLLLCSSKDRSELLMQSRCQINAWRETCTMAPVVKLVGGALHAFIGSMRWNTGKVWLFSFKVRVGCEEFHMQCFKKKKKSNLNYILRLRSLFSAHHGNYWLSLPSMKMWHAMFPAMHQITKLWSNIIIYYILIILLQTHKSSLFFKRMKQGWCYWFGYSLSSFTVYWSELL